MSGLTIDASHDRRALLAGQHRGADGVARWTSDLANSALLSVGLQAEARVSTVPTEAAWSVAVRRSERTVVIIDADDDAHDHGSIDRLELSATRTWRDVTRHASSGEMRPWLGAIRVISNGVPDAFVVERLEQLVAFRVLDAACVVMVDQRANEVWSPRPSLSINAFRAALIGRFFVFGTLSDSHGSRWRLRGLNVASHRRHCAERSVSPDCYPAAAITARARSAAASAE